ncbi:trimeric intracellular cation channel family protein [Leptospira sp. 'Mane']|uniref:trimeric intracellular cation channel family protein n=1 Tax=Leptospira sp. 'Mane' TaxID=3387407 RepID=UPI00398AFE9F
MLYSFELIGVAIAAFSGVLAARGKQIDLFGVIVLSAVTAFGGGTVRDVILGSYPIFWIEDEAFLVVSLSTALVAFFVSRKGRLLPEPIFQIADAAALALFAIIGAEKTFLITNKPLITITMGVVTGTVGGLLRDVFVGQIPMVFRKEIHLYATAAFLGAGLYLASTLLGFGSIPSFGLGVLVTFLVRMAAIRYRISLPVFVEKDQNK